MSDEMVGRPVEEAVAHAERHEDVLRDVDLVIVTRQQLDDAAEDDDPGIRVAVLRPGWNRRSVYGSIATNWAQRVGSNGCHGWSPPHGHVPARSPELCDIRLRRVTWATSPYGLWISRSSGTYLTAGSSSDSRPRSRSCMMAMPVNVLVTRRPVIDRLVVHRAPGCEVLVADRRLVRDLAVGDKQQAAADDADLLDASGVQRGDPRPGVGRWRCAE